MTYPDKIVHGTGIAVTTLPNLLGKGRWRLEGLRARRSHDFYWVTRGQGRLSINGRTRGYGPNSVLFIPAGSVYGLTTAANVQGYAATLPDILPVPVPGNPGLVKASSIFDQGQITSYFEQISREQDSKNQGFEQAMESYMTLLGIWIERNSGRNDWPLKSKPPAADRLVATFLRRLDTGFCRTGTTADYAADLNVTATHLSRVCRELLGHPASDLIRDRTVLEAQILLADTDMRINHVAEHLGVESAAYFSRMFKSSTTLSPRAFRDHARARPMSKASGTPGKIARK